VFNRFWQVLIGKNQQGHKQPVVAILFFDEQLIDIKGLFTIGFKDNPSRRIAIPKDHSGALGRIGGCEWVEVVRNLGSSLGNNPFIRFRVQLLKRSGFCSVGIEVPAVFDADLLNRFADFVPVHDKGMPLIPGRVKTEALIQFLKKSRFIVILEVADIKMSGTFVLCFLQSPLQQSPSKRHCSGIGLKVKGGAHIMNLISSFNQKKTGGLVVDHQSQGKNDAPIQMVDDPFYLTIVINRGVQKKFQGVIGIVFIYG